jgi:ABC-type glycerol-3-phosphate transport system substrate-binding protein
MKSHAKLNGFLVIAVVAMAFAGCAPQTPAATEPTATQPPSVEEPTAPVAEQITEVPPVVEMEPVTLRYANWNLGTEEENNIQRQLVKAYTDLNPHVTIEFVDMSAEGGWEANLTNYAARGELPDVFMANNVPLYVQNGWVADLTDMVADDPDWADIPQIMKDSFTYDGRVLGLPAAQFLMGYFVNQDLYEAANMDAPEYGFTVEEWSEAVTGLTNIPQGVLGLDVKEWIAGWYPNTVDPNLKWFSYDGEKMNYNSTAFKEGIALTAGVKPYTWDGLTDEQKANFDSTEPGQLFLNQEVGLRWEGSWSMPGFVQNATFDWDFVGVPGGNQAIVFDVMVVAQTTENLEEAYNFAKWMTFSKEAYVKEAELARAMDSAPKMPVSIDDASLALYKEFVDKPGINVALANLDNSMVESLAKIVPGYIQARWEGKPGIDIGEDKDVNMWFMFNFADSGRYKYEDYAAQLEEFTNNILAEAAAAMNQ